jgi:phosphoesterase RecJ-like protein
MTDTEKTIYKDIENLIRGSQSILVTSHEDPDGDSIGSQLAIRQLAAAYGKDAVIINAGDIPLKYRFLPDIEQIRNIRKYGGSGSFDLAFILECPDVERAGEVRNLISAQTALINIDHHPDNHKFGSVNLLDADASAVGEMLFDVFLNMDMAIDKNTATWLYTAILTDTGRFRYSSTTRKTMETAGRLIELGADPREICDNIYYSITPSTLRLTGQVLADIKFFEGGKICLLQLTRKQLADNSTDMSETDGLTDYTLFGRNVIVGGLLKEINDGRTKVSLRSRNSIDVSRLAHRYNGGGHHNAAGYTINLPLDKAGDRLLCDLKELLNGSI